MAAIAAPVFRKSRRLNGSNTLKFGTEEITMDLFMRGNYTTKRRRTCSRLHKCVFAYIGGKWKPCGVSIRPKPKGRPLPWRCHPKKLFDGNQKVKETISLDITIDLSIVNKDGLHGFGTRQLQPFNLPLDFIHN